MRKKFMLLALLCLLGNALWAQSRQISGEVTNQENGEPIAGVSVLIKGGSQGTSTDDKGKFKITIPENRKPVLVPWEPPLINTLTPAMGSPFSWLVTSPDICRLCAHSTLPSKHKRASNINFFLIQLIV